MRRGLLHVIQCILYMCWDCVQVNMNSLRAPTIFLYIKMIPGQYMVLGAIYADCAGDAVCEL